MSETANKSMHGRKAANDKEESPEKTWSSIKLCLGIMPVVGILVLIAGTVIFPEFKLAGDSRVILEQKVAKLELELAERDAVIEELQEKLQARHSGGMDGESTPFDPIDQQRVALRNATQQAIARSQLLEIRSQLTEIQANCRVLVQASDNWYSKQEALCTSDEGKSLAASTEYVQQFVALKEKDRVSQSRVNNLQEQLNLLSDVLGKPPKPEEVVVVPDSQFTSRLVELGKEIRDAAQDLDRDHQALKAILAETANKDANGPTLASAITMERQRAERQRVEQIEQARAAAMADANKEQAKAENEKVAAQQRIKTLLIQRDAKMAEQEAAGLDQDIADGIQAALLARDKKRRRKEALAQEVLSMLTPLTTPDYSQPYQILGTGADGKRTVEKQPVSFSRIKSLGVLDRTEQGLKKLALLNASNWTNRPRWPMSYEAPEPQLWTTAQQEMIVKTQTYLIKYGDILAEEGILAP